MEKHYFYCIEVYKQDKSGMRILDRKHSGTLVVDSLGSGGDVFTMSLDWVKSEHKILEGEQLMIVAFNLI